MAAAKGKQRDEMLAKIDERWGEFLAALDSVPAAARHIPGVCGYWAVPELVAHISYWESKVPDYVTRHFIGLKQAPNKVDAANRIVGAYSAAMPLPILFQQLSVVHEMMRTAVARLPETVPAPLAVDISWESWDHYPEHTAQLRTWTELWSRPGDRYQAIVEGMVALAGSIKAVQRRKSGACGGWSAQDLIGHLAFWDEARINEIEHKGGRLSDLPDYADYEAINAVEAERRRRWTWDQLVAEARSNAARLAPLLDGDGEDGLGEPIHQHWLDHYTELRDYVYAR